MPKVVVTDTLADASLCWALTHVRRYGDTDIFPTPFEFEIINAYWPTTLAHLRAIDFCNFELSPATKIMVPKASHGYRAATQLDPLDTLIYTAAIYEVAPQIEAYRVPRAQRIDCAYRIEIKPDGQFFQTDSGWGDFHGKTTDLVDSGIYTTVLCADIADFYNQVSHHRVQNALANAGVAEVRSKNIEQFLSRLNSLHHSKGVPVGSWASIPLAEACLTDVDLALQRKGYIHCRYVDDFRVFCRDDHDAARASHDLSEYLFKAHRLSLQGGKTKEWGLGDFVSEELIDPEQMEIRSKQEKLSSFVRDLDIPYGAVDIEDILIGREEEQAFVLETLRDLFDRSMDGGRLRLGLARYVLRRATQLKSRVFLDSFLKNIELFLPVLRDGISFLVKVSDPKNPEQIGVVLRGLLASSKYRHLPFVQLWVLEAFFQKPAFCRADEALRFAEACDPIIRDRVSALIAKAYNIRDWVRERKETWMNYGPWAQRALLWSSTVLPKDERGHWLKSAHGHPLFLTQAVAKNTC